jgi:hypothetical protein
MCNIAYHKDVLMARHREIRTDLHTPSAIRCRAKPRAGRRGHHACGPNDSARFDAFGAEDDAALIAACDASAEADFNAELVEGSQRRLRQRRIEWREQARARFHQIDA